MQFLSILFLYLYDRQSHFLSLGQDDKDLKATNATLIMNNGEKSYIVINGLKSDRVYMFATVVMNGNMKSAMSNFAEGHPVLIEG